MDFPLCIPFVKHLGFELVHFGGGRSEIRLVLQPEHGNSRGAGHGGLIMTLLDVAMAHASREREGESLTNVATIEMKTSFMRPSLGTLNAQGRLIQRTRSMAFCEGSIFDEAGRLCAHATGTFKYLKPEPTLDTP
jgi:uncharacterized protein (TIGR00369 family)